MAELASLQIKVVRDGIEQAQKALNDLSKAADSAEKSAGGVGKGFENAGKKTKGFNTDIMTLAKFVGGSVIAKGFYEIGSAALKAAADMEQQKVAFTTMLGSAEKANQLLKDMQSFAASTPFEMTEVVDAGKRLVAFGFDASTVIDNLRMLGDVSAGLSQPVGDMVYLFGQIKTQGRAMTQDLMQFANRGVPIYDELAKVLGVSTSQVKEFASQGKIGFKEIEQVFKNLTSEGGKFAGLMEAQSKTLAGRWSNFNDGLDKTLVLLGDKISPAASDLLSIVSLLVESYNNMLEAQSQSSDKAEQMPGYLEMARKWLDGTYSKESEVAQLKVAQLKSMEKMKGYLEGNISLSRQEMEWISKSYEIRQKELALLDDKSFVNTGQVNIEMQRVNQYKNTIKKKDDTSSGVGKSTYNYASELKHAKDVVMSGQPEEMQLIAKYQEEMKRLKTFDSVAIARGDKEGHAAALNAQIEASEQLLKNLKDLKGEGAAFNKVMSDLGKQLATTSLNAAAESFEKIGEALGKGEMSGRAMKKIMAEMMWQIIQALPMMLISAGLQMITFGNWPVGLALIGMGLAGQIGVGYMQGVKAKKEEEYAAENSAHGNVYGFAAGGSFTNELINSPTRFMFSRGGTTGRGLMGEAGPEAVVPLRRMTNGNLGVESTGGGEVVVNIINTTGEQVDVQKRPNNSGGMDLAVTIGAIVNSGIASGEFDKSMGVRYGVARRGR